MATSEQIQAASRAPTCPVGELHQGAHVLAMPRGDEEREAAERAAAAWHVRRLANRHDCAGLCGAPEHAADGRDRG